MLIILLKKNLGLYSMNSTFVIPFHYFNHNLRYYSFCAFSHVQCIVQSAYTIQKTYIINYHAVIKIG